MKMLNSLTSRLTLFVTLGYVLAYDLAFPAVIFLNDAIAAGLPKLVNPQLGTGNQLGLYQARDLVLEFASAR